MVHLGEINRWFYAAGLTARAKLDAGRRGGYCDVTITVRNSETQYNQWRGLQLNQHGHDLLVSETAPPPPITPSHERWTQFRNEGIGLFPLLEEDFQDNPQHQAFGLKCGKSYLLLDCLLW